MVCCWTAKFACVWVVGVGKGYPASRAAYAQGTCSLVWPAVVVLQHFQCGIWKVGSVVKTVVSGDGGSIEDGQSLRSGWHNVHFFGRGTICALCFAFPAVYLLTQLLTLKCTQAVAGTVLLWLAMAPLLVSVVLYWSLIFDRCLSACALLCFGLILFSMVYLCC